VVTIDASVLVAVDAADESGRDDARAFLRRVVETRLPIHQPSLAVVEVTSAVVRRTLDASIAREAAMRLLDLPGLVLHALDAEDAVHAAGLAGQTRLRAADAVYAAVTLRAGTDLVTLDVELHERAASVVPTFTPSEWLARRG
jgi:predicted nucleic acid-binding protein